MIVDDNVLNSGMACTYDFPAAKHESGGIALRICMAVKYRIRPLIVYAKVLANVDY